MLLLHTSDWHIGRALCGRRRYRETGRFLDWLADWIEEHLVDVLLVAGDIFDTSTPGNRAQSLYYRFLCRVAASACRHVVVISGNHDSPSLLAAPRELLRELRIHVITAPAPDPADQVLLLDDADGRPELVLCAVPYLRDRDIRRSAPGESMAEKQARLLEGIRAHYRAVCGHGIRLRNELDIPLVAMGHLFAAGGQVVDGDGVRELAVGGLDRVETDIFPPEIDYLALGHLHQAQRVGGADNRRYSGAPLAMGFAEAGREKSVLAVRFTGRRPAVQKVPVPCFRPLYRISGDLEMILSGLADLVHQGDGGLVEVVYTGDAVVAGLGDQVFAAVEGTDLEVLSIRNTRAVARAMARMHSGEALEEMDEEEVFRRLLEDRGVPEHQRGELENCFREILLTLHEQDRDA